MRIDFLIKLLNFICIPESFIKKHKLQKMFLNSKPVLNIRFEDFWYTKINPRQIWYYDFN